MANEIWIYDVIGEGFWTEGVTAKYVRDELAKFKPEDRITARINSPGGDAFEGVAILTMLQQHKGGVDVQIDGVAASAASLIATVGENVTIADGAMLMIHRAWTCACGNEEDLQRAVQLLSKLDGKLADAYVTKCGRDRAEVVEKLNAETWFTSDEAIEFGLCDGKVEIPAKAFAIPKEFAYKHAPANRIQQHDPLPQPKDNRTPASIAAMKRRIDLARARRSA